MTDSVYSINNKTAAYNYNNNIATETQKLAENAAEYNKIIQRIEELWQDNNIASASFVSSAETQYKNIDILVTQLNQYVRTIYNMLNSDDIISQKMKEGE